MLYGRREKVQLNFFRRIPPLYKRIYNCIYTTDFRQIFVYTNVLTAVLSLIIVCFCSEIIGIMQNILKQIFMMNIKTVLTDYAAMRAFQKNDTVVNMRMNSKLVDKIKALAAEQGVPYQTLIAATLNKITEEDK